MSMRRIIGLGAIALLSLVLTGCHLDVVFQCEESGQCGAGRCEPDGFCSFTDGDCPQGYRYGDHAGGLSGQCVGVFIDASVPDAESADAERPDAGIPMPCGPSGCSCLTEMAAGGFHTCAIGAADQLYCWGRDFEGQVGDGMSCLSADLSPSVAMPTLIATGVDTVAGGRQHGCFFESNPDAVRCWGDNARSQSSCGPTNICAPQTAAGVPTSLDVQLALGDLHSCSRSGTSVSCWGQNNFGELGFTASDSTTCSASTVATPGPTLDLAAGRNTTCGIFMQSTPSVWCWGSNVSGTCGVDPTVSTPGCVAASTGLTAGTCGAPRQVLAGGTFDEIAVGGGHACVHAPTTGIECWGDNADGAVGSGAAIIPTPQAVIGFPGGSVPTPHLALGDDHSCAIVDAPGQPGAVFCWGKNDAGQLGLAAGAAPSSTTPIQIMRTPTAPLYGIQAITAGARHTCAQWTGGAILCWGDNSCGQLGDGNGGNCNADTLPAPLAVPEPVYPLLTCP